MITNELIFKEIKNMGFMTESQMKLIKNRSNKEQKDLFNYDLIEEFGFYGVPISDGWADKGIKWLRSLLKKNGEPKSGQNLGYREIEIIKTAKASDFSFVCFYDAGNGFFRNYIPVYNIAGMEYRVENGKIIVTG